MLTEELHGLIDAFAPGDVGFTATDDLWLMPVRNDEVGYTATDDLWLWMPGRADEVASVTSVLRTVGEGPDAVQSVTSVLIVVADADVVTARAVDALESTGPAGPEQAADIAAAAMAWARTLDEAADAIERL